MYPWICADSLTLLAFVFRFYNMGLGLLESLMRRPDIMKGNILQDLDVSLDPDKTKNPVFLVLR
jgi:hypothetical protein